MKNLIIYTFLIFSALLLFANCNSEPTDQSANLLLQKQLKGVERFEEEIVAFEKSDANHFPQKNAILFVGSSSIRFWESLEEDMSPLPVINRGFGGATLPEVYHYAERIIFPYEPKMIVLYCGENDIHEDRLPSLVVSNFKKVIKLINKNLPDTKIVFLGLKPSLNRWKDWSRMKKTNEMISRFAENMENLEYIEVSKVMLKNGKPDPDIFVEDGLHMNEEGYARWTELIKPQIEAFSREEG